MRERNFETQLAGLVAGGNLRQLPTELPPGLVDFTSNDYLGLAADAGLRDRFFSGHDDPGSRLLSSSASRLLAGTQKAYSSLEKTIEESFLDAATASGAAMDRREAILFNSGYHANTGIIPALASRGDLILDDSLAHASIIDGIRLSRADYRVFPHNDVVALERLILQYLPSLGPSNRILVVVESVYSMDGDTAPLRELAALRRQYPQVMLYVDEAHAIGVRGPAGLGEVLAQGVAADTDVIVGTFGKALASMGAFALVSPVVKRFLVNKARSLIFSTALPPLQVAWTETVWRHALGCDSLREALNLNARLLADIIPGADPSHIRPLIVGDARLTVELSRTLAKEGFNVLPIRTPTVPPGTERLRFSLSATVSPAEIRRLGSVLIASDKQ
ncbi:MAG: 8-amino-7-oxononanoate synthase [Muribaculaceae bacterium]|nr:8-amino-7-oxononanoate synthase [Muribaculaceae bacterium]